MNPKTIEAIVDAKRAYRSDPEVFEAVINKLRQGNRVIAAAAEILLENARADVACTDFDPPIFKIENVAGEDTKMV